MIGRSTNRGEVHLQLLTKHNCPLCDHANDVLRRVAVDFCFETSTVWLESPEGEFFANEYQTPFPPVLVINGRVHGYGRLSEKLLRRELDRMEVPRRRIWGRLVHASSRRLFFRSGRGGWYEDD